MGIYVEGRPLGRKYDEPLWALTYSTDNIPFPIHWFSGVLFSNIFSIFFLLVTAVNSHNIPFPFAVFPFMILFPFSGAREKRNKERLMGKRIMKEIRYGKEDYERDYERISAKDS